MKWASMAAICSLSAAKLVLLVCVPCCVLVYALFYHSTGVGNSGDTSQQCSSPHRSPYSSLPHSKRRVLVTGAAGFIGYHVTKALIEDWQATVVGLDLFTNYYDPQLKHDRGNELIKAGATLYEGNVCDAQLLQYLFDKYHFTDVVHLAAQTGVRYSLKDPQAYIHNNIGCFHILLDALRLYNGTSLVYASSSTVYGHSSPLPFTPSAPPQPPSSIYAATKQSNELFSKLYCTLYGISSIGIRPFTVYGPWGRPDMSVYKFTERISNGIPIPQFTSSHPVKRDFTYVDDVVNVFLAALDHTPKCCGEVYNAGLGEPVSLVTLVSMLEEELGKTAYINESALLSCELQVTWADMRDTERVLGYSPKVRLKEGLSKFVAWYRDYSKQMELGGAGQLKGLIRDAVKLLTQRSLEHENQKYRDRIRGLRKKYQKYAYEHSISQPDLTKKGFIFYPGKESAGYTVIKAPSYKGNQKLLEERCLATEQCIAFTSSGEFKNQLVPISKWAPLPPGEGMYVADIDLCASDLHHCGKHSDCVYTGPANYTCRCPHGYCQLGKHCVERYVSGVVGESEEAWHLSDQFDGLDWEELTHGIQFVFFQGLDSPGGDYLVVEGGNVEKVKEACLSTRHCVGFNTNGILKDSLRPPSGWVRWVGPDHPEHGLYVLDMDYCRLDVEQCPPHAECTKHAPGEYSCTCLPPYTLTDDGTCKLDYIHVILSTDSEHLPGLVSAVNSTLSHTHYPKRINFHIVFIGDKATVESYLNCYGYKDHPQIDIVIFNASIISDPIKVYSKVSDVGHLASLGNFARFYFHLLFPELSRAIYLDVDVIVLADVVEIWNQLVETDGLLVAAPRTSPTYGDMLSADVNKKFKERYNKEFDTQDVTYNAGVYGVNFDLWREDKISEEISYWMNEQAKAPLWSYGTQPIMLLVTHGRWAHLDPQWNVNGLGWNTRIHEKELKQAKLLHWSGKGKPWLDTGLYKELWRAHSPHPCGGHGECVLMEIGIYTCIPV